MVGHTEEDWNWEFVGVVYKEATAKEEDEIKEMEKKAEMRSTIRQKEQWLVQEETSPSPSLLDLS